MRMFHAMLDCHCFFMSRAVRRRRIRPLGIAAFIAHDLAQDSAVAAAARDLRKDRDRGRTPRPGKSGHVVTGIRLERLAEFGIAIGRFARREGRHHVALRRTRYLERHEALEADS